MDAWESLISKSTLTGDHDAWGHLNAQGGGSGGYVLATEVEVELVSVCVDVEIVDDPIDVEVVDNIDVDIVEETIEVEVDCE